MKWNHPATLFLTILFTLTVLRIPAPTQAAGTCRTTEITSVRTLDSAYAVRFDRCIVFIVTPRSAAFGAPQVGPATVETLVWTNLNKKRFLRQIITDGVGNTYQTSPISIP